jgi:putative sterol carrier protein
MKKLYFCVLFFRYKTTKTTEIMDLKAFFTNLPSKIDPAALEGMESSFHFDVEGGGQYTVRLEGGKMNVEEGLVGEAKCKVSTSLESFGKLLSGDLNPMQAMLFGKLKISNPGEMLKYAKIFGLM